MPPLQTSIEIREHGGVKKSFSHRSNFLTGRLGHNDLASDIGWPHSPNASITGQAGESNSRYCCPLGDCGSSSNLAHNAKGTRNLEMTSATEASLDTRCARPSCVPRIERPFGREPNACSR